MTKRAVLYCRVSTEEQARHGFSLRQQAEALKAWCAVEGYEVAEVVEDPGYSGAHLERPGLDRVRDLVAGWRRLRRPRPGPGPPLPGAGAPVPAEAGVRGIRVQAPVSG